MRKPGRKNSAALRARQLQAVTMRLAGETYETISAALGYDGPSGAWKAVQSGLRFTMQEPADRLRHIEAARCERLIAAHWPAALRGDGNAASIVAKFIRLKVGLLGLSRPAEIALKPMPELRVVWEDAKPDVQS